MESLIFEITDDLKTELGLTDASEIAVLSGKVKSAVKEVRLMRNYPNYFTESRIESDLNNHYSIIKGVALYDFNQLGAEGQLSHSEPTASRTWKPRSDCFIGLVAYCR